MRSDIPMKCPICSGNKVCFALEITVTSGKPWHIYQCKDCLARFVDPMPSPQEARQYYEQNSTRAKTLSDPRYGWLTYQKQRRIIRNLVRKPHGRILDFGCGGGHFLDNYDRGWEKFGCELSEDAREVSTRKGIKTFATLEEAAFPNEFMDVVVMFAVIEHLTNPKDVVSELNRVLKVEGLFVVMTGDVMSLKARIKAQKWHMYGPPEHIFFLSAQSLDLLMASQGLRKIQSIYTDGGMSNRLLRPCLMILEEIPVLKSLPLFDHYYGYYRKEL